MFFKIGGTYYVVLYEIQFTRRWNRGRVFVMGWDGIWKDDGSFTVESRETLEAFDYNLVTVTVLMRLAVSRAVPGYGIETRR